MFTIFHPLSKAGRERRLDVLCGLALAVILFMFCMDGMSAPPRNAKAIDWPHGYWWKAALEM